MFCGCSRYAMFRGMLEGFLLFAVSYDGLMWAVCWVGTRGPACRIGSAKVSVNS